MRFLETVTLGEAVIFLGGLAVVFGVIRKVWPFLRKMVQVVDALDGLPGLVEEMRESVETVTTITDQVATIHHEVTPNGGGSMKDELRRQSETLARVDAAQLAAEAQLLEQGKQIEGVRSEQRNVAERLSRHLDGPRP